MTVLALVGRQLREAPAQEDDVHAAIRDGEAMSSTYRAGLLVGSHDDAVLARLDLARRWELHDGGRLEAHDPPT